MAEESMVAANANRTIKNHVYGALGIGLIPVPLVDILGLTGLQLNMVRKLAGHHEVSFRKDIVKTIIASLAGGIVPATYAQPFAVLIRAVPIIGYPIGAISMSLTGAAVTYGLGHVFNMHFASGGTLLDFDIEKMRTYYEEKCSEGKKLVAEVSAQAPVSNKQKPATA